MPFCMCLRTSIYSLATATRRLVSMCFLFQFIYWQQQQKGSLFVVFTVLNLFTDNSSKEPCLYYFTVFNLYTAQPAVRHESDIDNEGCDVTVKMNEDNFLNCFLKDTLM